ncbi:dGTPase [Psychrosphaera sp. F3M07]|uniref:dGTPase n=1 Tax=Psychrosphaera sp. F3M07 TaxID=2841560 RepID=UPI001C08953F|nr:dGTPase [Psychrosphaera sp. F3M07]MBU2916570.1 dGTPase [Psychrosphaera sp. F3M07]
MDFSKKINATRRYNNNPNANISDQFESDRGRIIQSAAIRRLQQKTQVFPLERNSAVRSRLTHSLEVQQTGRHIVRTIFKKLGADAKQYGLDTLEREIESLVEMSCLMHDIGNPPFGHFGEAAINHWFNNHLDKHVLFSQADNKMLSLQIKQELKSFEGNAQAFRIIFNLLKLNLTYSQAASILKYTRCGLDMRPEKDKPLSYLKKKVGFYYSELDDITLLCDHLEVKPGHRFPLAYLMEAADDISYCLADIEDGVEKGLLNCKHLAELLKSTFTRLSNEESDPAFLKGKSFHQAVDYALARAEKEPINKTHEFFVWLRVQLIHPLVEHAASSFIDNIQHVYDGDLNRALLEDDSLFHQMISTFKEVAIKYIFSTNEVETKELQGYRIITGLLDTYEPLLLMRTEQFQNMVSGEKGGGLIEARLFKRLPKKHLKAYQQALLPLADKPDFKLHEFYYRCRLIQDNISGMTDQYALEEYQNLYVG